ncbi:MAG: cupin domain-containing protein [Terrabacter sp.]
MTTTPSTSVEDIDDLDDLYAVFDGLSVEGGWHRRTPALWPEPRHNFLPHVWRYAELKTVLEVAGRLVDHQMADRRNLTLTNPVEGNLYATVRTLVAAYQLIKPGEVALAHHHTPAALRIILDGRGTYTVVDGDRVEMRPGDVLLTPSWAWHEHSAAGPDDCYWVDILDVPLVHLLEPMFFEKHPDGVQAEPRDIETSPIAFRWEDSLARLAEQTTAPAHGMAEREIELGGPAMPTIALHVQELGAGFTSVRQRTTANSIFTVVEGAGRTIVDGETLTWERGDIVAIPAWRPYQHVVSQSARLVRSSDEPVLTALGLLRTETL